MSFSLRLRSWRHTGCGLPLWLWHCAGLSLGDVVFCWRGLFLAVIFFVDPYPHLWRYWPARVRYCRRQVLRRLLVWSVVWVAKPINPLVALSSLRRPASELRRASMSLSRLALEWPYPLLPLCMTVRPVHASVNRCCATSRRVGRTGLGIGPTSACGGDCGGMTSGPRVASGMRVNMSGTSSCSGWAPGEAQVGQG